MDIILLLVFIKSIDMNILIYVFNKLNFCWVVSRSEISGTKYYYTFCFVSYCQIISLLPNKEDILIYTPVRGVLETRGYSSLLTFGTFCFILFQFHSSEACIVVPLVISIFIFLMTNWGEHIFMLLATWITCYWSACSNILYICPIFKYWFFY